MAKLYVEANNSMIGPIDSKEVIELIRRGEISRSSMVSVGESDEWREARSIKGLEQYFAEADAATEERRKKAEAVKAEAERALKDVERRGDNILQMQQAMEAAIWRTKSYRTHRIALMTLYFLGWFPGLIAHIILLEEVNHASKKAGFLIDGTVEIRRGFYWMIGVTIVIALLVVFRSALLE